MDDERADDRAEDRADELALREADAWFVRHGLPYFDDALRAQAVAGLDPRRMVPIGVLGVLAGVAVSVLVGSDASDHVLAGLLGLGAGLALYGVARLRVAPMAAWAFRRTFSSLGLLFPLVTRALPLLLLFITFLFVNTEVWQVASNLDNGVLWVAVLLFAGVAVGFLLVRLPEELDRVDDEIVGERLVAACARTPLADVAPRYADRDLNGLAQVRGFERGNLVFVLLVTQAIQVLLLSLAVYAFFVLFGSVAIREPVMTAWLGAGEVHWLVPGWHVVSWELLQVSTFLAAFAGLYFTVYAVSDEVYRAQFFGSLLRELERSVAIRAVYRSLRADRADRAV